MNHGLHRDPHPEDLLGAYVVDACSADEAAAVAEHAAHCARCSTEIDELSDAAHWIGATNAAAPEPGLRSRVLSAALAARPAGEPEIGALLEPYKTQLATFGRLLRMLTPAQWRLPAGPHSTVGDMVTHLTTNDQLVAADLGMPVRLFGPDTLRLWHDQADALTGKVAGADVTVLDHPVRLAGPRTVRRPLREALVQRAFETWIHAEDIRTAVGLPAERPGTEQLTRIADFALGLLPQALDAFGRARPGDALRLVLLDDDAEHRRTVALSGTRTAGTAVVATVTVPLEAFCRLLAGRNCVEHAGARIDGDERAAGDFLAVAALMGCD
jgi:uncharacterized protein (TIGR03083 family)